MKLGSRALAAAALLAACGGPPPAPAPSKHGWVSSAPELRTIAVGALVACAVHEGDLVCWGSRLYVPGPGDLPWERAGSIGVEDTQAPFRVRLPGDVSSVALSDSRGWVFGCVTLADGRVLCWGPNRDGEMADGTCRGGLRSVPIEIPLPGDASSVSLVGTSACALLDGGRVACWGTFGERFEGLALCAPELVRTTDGEPLEGVVSLEAGAATLEDGTFVMWGDDTYGQVSRRPERERLEAGLVATPVEGRAVRATRTERGVCSLSDEGVARCWGDLLPIDDTTTPTVPAGLPRVVDVRCSPLGACVALGRDANLYTWGHGDNFTTHPVRREFHAHADEIAIGDGGCWREGADVFCWGAALAGVRDDWESAGTPVRVEWPR